MFESDIYTEIVSLDGYSAAGANQMPYRMNALSSIDLSGIEYQAICFWNSSGKLVIGVRVTGGVFSLYAYDGSGGLPNIAITSADAHRAVSLGLDPNGYIHIVYDHGSTGADALKYRKSVNPISSFDGNLSGVLSMLGGVPETHVIYPTFHNDNNGNLYFLFKYTPTGVLGDLYAYKYNHATTTWTSLAGLTAGKLVDGLTDSHGEYFSNLAFDSDFGSGGYVHFFWNWQVDGSDVDGRYRVSYIRWDGTNWTQSDGDAQAIPIRDSTSETVDPVAIHNGLCYMMGADSDSSGHPHVAYAKNDGDGYYNAFHAWHNGTIWQISQVTTSPYPIATTTLVYPTIAIRRSTNVAYILYINHPNDVDGLLVSTSSNYSSWTQTILYPEPIHVWWWAHYDRLEWRTHEILRAPIENWDTSGGPFPIRIFEYTLPTVRLKSGASFLKSGASFLTN